MLVNSANLEIAFNGFNAAFNKGSEGYKPSYSQVAMTIPSSSASETYGWLGQFPKMREWLGDRVIQSLAAHKYTIENKKFETTIEVSREQFEDDKYGIFGPLMQELGRTAAEYPDELIYSLLLKGFSTFCYDGQYYFDPDHPVKDASGNIVSVANTDGGNGLPWFLLDTSRAIKPLIFQERIKPKLTQLDGENDQNVFMKDQFLYGVRARSNAGFGLWQLAWGSKQNLTAATYETARVGLGKMTGDEGRPLNIRPNLLVVGTSLEGAARALLFNDLNDGGGSNKWKGSAELLVVPWLG